MFTGQQWEVPRFGLGRRRQDHVSHPMEACREAGLPQRRRCCHLQGQDVVLGSMPSPTSRTSLTRSLCDFSQAWAEFKGKLADGGKDNPASWKTRLRCALNKSPEFTEVMERAQLDITEPYKVYRLVPTSEQSKTCVLHSSTDLFCPKPEQTHV